ncbi:sigma-70 family RNA polymerase sigma factor [Gloeocapsa sp. PCC 73106]|uniref:sigma-70 family RNA polymerase sigma factor n=1 Tax=Gloeocapsa sp. PCC 73106 TaxID=102232 RepID=UPI0002AC42FC|nr:sigma-70 family RNA polymerase sigma factor [Gloeocapsa sp. PCC 73106]ELR96253.1 RNA polymerase sigma factor, sigma-70 family [Gloeocapsa sp. PCC 73106]
MDSSTLNLQCLELFLAYSSKPSVKIRNQLVRLNLGLVKKVAYRISRQCAEPYEDLQQIGYLGLIRAIERFNPSLGSAFSSFAIPYIRGEILHYLRDRGTMLKIPRRWQDLAKKGAKIRKKMLSQDGNLPNDLELARMLSITLTEWQQCQLAFQNRLTVSLDLMVGQMLDSSVSFGDTIPDVHEQTIRGIEEERSHLQSAINELEEKTKRAIEWVFLQDLSRKEVAQRIGMSPMTVTRHLKKGIAELAVLLNSHHCSFS